MREMEEETGLQLWYLETQICFVYHKTIPDTDHIMYVSQSVLKEVHSWADRCFLPCNPCLTTTTFAHHPINCGTALKSRHMWLVGGGK